MCSHCQNEIKMIFSFSLDSVFNSVLKDILTFVVLWMPKSLSGRVS